MGLTRPLSVVFVLVIVAAGAVVAQAGDGVPFVPDRAAKAGHEIARVASVPPRSGVVALPPGGADLFASPGGEPILRAHEGIVFALQRAEGDWLEVVTTCNQPAWVRADDVVIWAASDERMQPGPGFDLAAATIVLDPGHGARDWGGVGPGGLTEKAVNLDIAERIRRLMSSARDVDWTSGEVRRGTAIPAFGSVWLTRSLAGPSFGDYELGLEFRAALANAAGADVLVSIHNNTVPRQRTTGPGTEVYYAVGTEGSDRLAGLIHEELVRSLATYTADWRGGDTLGARARLDPATGLDYYGLLRRATMPSVIVEGLYISEPEEEALLATPAVRQSYAEGVYRGIIRFLTTTDQGGATHPPEEFGEDAGTVSSTGCEIPPQP